MKKESQSILDYLTQIMPELKDFKVVFLNKPKIDTKAANTLFSIWKDESNLIAKDRLKRPYTLSLADISLMEKEGLIKSRGDNIEITDKGGQVIKTMILGDEKSVWEDKGDILDYSKALANSKPKKRVLTSSVIKINNWYQKLIYKCP